MKHKILGLSSIEYALISLLIAISIFLSINTLGVMLDSVYTNISESLQTDKKGCPAGGQGEKHSHGSCSK